MESKNPPSVFPFRFPRGIIFFMNPENKVTGKTYSLKHSQQTLYEQIANSLEERILKNKTDEKRLPSEMSLVNEYGVSRSVIREALKTLKERGLVTTRAGGRSRITIPESDTISRAMGTVTKFNGISDEKIFKVRSILESAAAAAAAEYASVKDIEKLSEIVDRMSLCKSDREKRARLDCEFHYKIAEMSQNELLSFMVQSLMDILIGYIIKRLELYPSGHEAGIIGHRKIIKAIESHNRDLASKQMARHIEISFHEID